MNKVILMASVLVLFFACKNDAPAPVKELTPEEKMELMRAEAEVNKTKLGRVNSGLKTLQDEYTKAEKSYPNLKNVKVSVDSLCNLVVTNDANGGETWKLNLNDLDTGSKIRLMADNGDDIKFPGIAFGTTSGENLIEYTKGGQKTMVNEWIIIMATRDNIQNIAPAVIQTINICNGKFDEMAKD